MTIEEIRANAPDGAEHHHRKIGYLKGVFGKHVKPKVWIDGEWRNINLLSALEPKDFKDIKPL